MRTIIALQSRPTRDADAAGYGARWRAMCSVIAMDNELIELEHRGWVALCGPSGAEFYDRLMTDEAMMVFAFGTLDRAASIEAIRAAPPWRTFRIESAIVVHPAPDIGIVVYRATARRGEGDEYRAWMSSAYVRDADGAWRLALHQQSPV